MKLAFLLSLLLLATLVQDSEAGFFRRLGRRIKSSVKKVTSGVKDVVGSVRHRVTSGVKDVVGTVRHTVGRTVHTARDGARRLKDLFGMLRGKRSALTLNRLDDVNAVDIATTLNLDLPAVKDVFVRCDVDKSNSLDGQEVLSFLRMIEEMSTVSGRYTSSKRGSAFRSAFA